MEGKNTGNLINYREGEIGEDANQTGLHQAMGETYLQDVHKRQLQSRQSEIGERQAHHNCPLI